MLVGRSAEQARFGVILERARRGESGVLVLRGEAGIGKTVLLDEAVARAGGFRVLRVVGVEPEGAIAFAGLQQLLHPIVEWSDELPAPQRRALAAALGLDDASAPDALLVSVATLSLIAAAAETTPILCVVDDAQWLDDASASTLAFVARRLHAESVAILVAVREPATSTFAGEGLDELVVGGIDGPSARALLASHAPDLTPTVAAQLVELTHGNPLALLELPRALDDDQRAGIAPLDDPLPVAVEVERAFGRRALRLAPGIRRALVVVAAGSPADGDAVSTALARTGVDAPALSGAAAAGLLVPGRLEFSHPLARSAVYQLAGPDERRDAHGALAAATAAGDRKAWHLAAAATAPDEEVAAALEAAADAARRRGGVAAEARALERAAALTPADEARAGRLLKAALAAEAAGWSDLADRMLRDVAGSTASREVRAEALARRSYLLADRGEFARAHAVSLDAAEHAPPPKAARALALGSLMALTHLLDIDAAVDIAERAQRLDGGGPGGDLHVVENTCRTWILAGRRDEARALVRASLDRIRASTQLELVINFGTDLMYLEDYDRARELLEGVLVRARETASLPFLAYALDQAAKLETRAGKLLRAYAFELESVRINEALGTDVAVAASVAWLALVEALLGRPESSTHARRALGIAERRGDSYNLVRARSALATDALARGDVANAAGELESAISTVVDGGVRDPNFFRLDPDLVEALARLGRHDEARLHVRRLDEQARATNGTWARSVALRCHALLADDGATADALFAEAVETLQTDPSPFEAARTDLCHGERLRRDRRRRDARGPLRRAVEAFSGLEARPWADRARAELAATGEHVERRDPGDVDRLTPQEFQIASLVGEGLTNRDVGARLFLSPKTVEFHLTAVFRKLDVRSRGELIRRLARESRVSDIETMSDTASMP